MGPIPNQVEHGNADDDVS